MRVVKLDIALNIRILELTYRIYGGPIAYTVPIDILVYLGLPRSPSAKCLDNNLSEHSLLHQVLGRPHVHLYFPHLSSS